MKKKKVHMVLKENGTKMALCPGMYAVVTEEKVGNYHVFKRFGHIGCDLNSDEILVVGK